MHLPRPHIIDDTSSSFNKRKPSVQAKDARVIAALGVLRLSDPAVSLQTRIRTKATLMGVLKHVEKSQEEEEEEA